MGADDDANCPHLVWELHELAVNERGGFDRVERCPDCDAVRYRTPPDMSRRPPL